MFDIGGVELLVIAAVAILVVGPRELPAMLRGIGKLVRQVREMTGSVQRQFSEALKEAELDDVKKTFDDVRSLNPATQIKNTIAKEMAPLTEVGDSLKSAAHDVKNIGTAGSDVPDAPSAEPAKASQTTKPTGDGSTLTQSKARAPKASTEPKAAPATAAAPVKKGPASKTAARKPTAKTATPKRSAAKKPASKPSPKKPAAAADSAPTSTGAD